MGALEEITKADRDVKDAEIRVATIKTAVAVLDSKLDELIALRDQRKENLDCLKQDKIVAMAKEYKKIKEELAILKEQIILKSNEREDIKKALKKNEDVLEEAKDLHKWLTKKTNNVLTLKFRK